MPDAIYADPSERLPWLSNAAPAAVPKATDRTVRELVGWAVAALLVIAGASYWLGTQSAGPVETDQIAASGPASPGATLKLPEPRADVQPQVAIPELPEARPAPPPAVDAPREDQVRQRQPKLRRAEPSISRREQSGRSNAGPNNTGSAPAPTAAPVASAPAQAPRLWPSRQVEGAAGRLVQIGAFGSRQQAKLGWRRMERAYPAVGRLPAVVVEARNSKGRKFYRFQIGTTSHAHSEILCQRMDKIRFSCAVIGLPWKAKIER